jgi:hypothetical protein
MLPPGQKFIFFIDPHAGMDRVNQSGSRIVYCERTDATPQFHYTWMTTSEYRSQFSYLAYYAPVGSSFQIQVNGEVLEYASVPIIGIEKQEYLLPLEVAQEGAVEITAVIHSNTSYWLYTHRGYALYDQGQDEQDHDEQGHHRAYDLTFYWPEETGGQETLQKLDLLCGQRFSVDSQINFGDYKTVMSQIEALILPERERLQTEMNKAIHHMLELIFSE